MLILKKYDIIGSETKEKRIFTMKVLLVNGSPHEKGCTYTALSEIAATLKEEGIDSEIFHVGTDALSGCLGCGHCAREGKCVFDDKVNEFLDLAADFDGFVFGSPVHFASISGAMTSFMDRVFYSDGCARRRTFNLKPAITLVSARRAGTTAALDQLNKYPLYSQMPLIASRYWNMVHGATPADVLRDEEGLQTMRCAARNMAFFLKCIEAGKKESVELPKNERKIMTNFIR